MNNIQVLEQQRATIEGREQPADPYSYDWHEVLETLANGERKWTRLPLTPEDVLHPEEDDVLMPTDKHERIRGYLYDVATALVEDDPTAPARQTVCVSKARHPHQVLFLMRMTQST